MTIRLSENFRALFYAPFYATKATGAFAAAGVGELSSQPRGCRRLRARRRRISGRCA